MTITPRQQIHSMVSEVAAASGFSLADVIGRDRREPIIQVRAQVIHRLRDQGWSLPKIGRLLGGRDHTTIHHLLSSRQPDGTKRHGHAYFRRGGQ